MSPPFPLDAYVCDSSKSSPSTLPSFSIEFNFDQLSSLGIITAPSSPTPSVFHPDILHDDSTNIALQFSSPLSIIGNEMNLPSITLSSNGVILQSILTELVTSRVDAFIVTLSYHPSRAHPLNSHPHILFSLISGVLQSNLSRLS
jgi:hypothetical protein